MRERCVIAALLAAYANWPRLLPLRDGADVDDLRRIALGTLTALRQQRQERHRRKERARRVGPECVLPHLDLGLHEVLGNDGGRGHVWLASAQEFGRVVAHDAYVVDEQLDAMRLVGLDLARQPLNVFFGAHVVRKTACRSAWPHSLSIAALGLTE